MLKTDDSCTQASDGLVEKESVSNDPWAHRSKGMRCGSCMWFVRKIDVGSIDGTTSKGRCRRHAPTMNGYPVVFETDWCGDHKLA